MPKKECVHFQGAAAGMLGAFDIEAFAVVDTAGDFEDHGDVEEVGAGEAKIMIDVGLDEVGIILVIECVVHIVIDLEIEHLFYFIITT